MERKAFAIAFATMSNFMLNESIDHTQMQEN